jgi:hypothetical protein
MKCCAAMAAVVEDLDLSPFNIDILTMPEINTRPTALQWQKAVGSNPFRGL